MPANNRRLPLRLQRLAEASPAVLTHRLRGAVRREWLDRTRGWERIESNVARSQQNAHGRRVLVDAHAVTQLQAAVNEDSVRAVAQHTLDLAVAQGKVGVFGFEFPIPHSRAEWHTDPRAGFAWGFNASTDYDFYEPFEREPHFDVKMPWEIGRMALVPRLLAAGIALDQLDDVLPLLTEFVDGWRTANPMGMGIHWQAMETSIRSLHLAMGAELCVLAGEVELAEKLTELAIVCGEFVYRSSEWATVAGNHFAANVAAMSVLGAKFANDVPSAVRWLEFGKRHTAEQVVYQFNEDGLHHEGSTGYHRLCVELFLLANKALSYANHHLPAAARGRLHLAVEAGLALVRPDDTSMPLGDADDATAVELDGFSGAPHVWAMLDLGLSFVNSELDEELAAGIGIGLSSAVLLDTEQLGRRQELSTRTLGSVRRLYPATGVFVQRTESRGFFAIDVGDVGQKGRGGHGHNDVLSYEWWFDGKPIIVDIGTYSYTASRELRDEFRATRRHNGAVLDGDEIAELLGVGWISNSALTVTPQMIATASATELTAAHTGYMREGGGAIVVRRIKVASDLSELTIEDQIIGERGEPAILTQPMHFAPGLAVHLDSATTAHVFGPEGARYHVWWGWDAAPTSSTSVYSDSYGHLGATECLCLSGACPSGSATYHWAIATP